jgi:4-hydroxy-3-polyprenylbenzoate decarboxylase
MHWQLHKTGANHFEAYKKRGEKMPVSVVLGGDPVYTYAATAPLPENIDEYILAGFLRRKGVKMVKCITNNISVPEDADFVIEGYVDPAEEQVWEGPFGDHTGFYSLADWYPKFHVTCITHSNDAIYPATIVGIPPQEDAFLAKATEKIFLAPIRLTLQPEIEDLHMPDPGVAHNLVVVKIGKSYPGQGMKVINSLFGAGQMMFTKYLVVVNGDVDIRNYTSLLYHIFKNTDFGRDILFCRGPLDVLDHSSDTFAFGGKVGIDSTTKTEGETNRPGAIDIVPDSIETMLVSLVKEGLITAFNIVVTGQKLPLMIISAKRSVSDDIVERIIGRLKGDLSVAGFKLIIIVDDTVDVHDPAMVAWQLLGNSDPVRDHYYIFSGTLLIDGTIKLFRKAGFARKWPNVVCSDNETIKSVDAKWQQLSLGNLIPSPSLRYLRLKRSGRDEISLD